MPAQLLIRDAAPNWWLSPDIWTVPGNDPGAVPGIPVAGQSAYVWAHVSNLGNDATSGTRVDFYWANPATQIVVGTATQIGSAFVDLASTNSPGDSQDVLCLVPWKPAFVNGGHECLIAVAHHPADITTLPDPLPSGFAFDPTSYNPIAQRNLNILAADTFTPCAIAVTSYRRQDKKVIVSVEVGGSLEVATLSRLRLKGFTASRKSSVKAGLSREAVCSNNPSGKASLELQIPRGTETAVYLSLKTTGLKDREYQLIHVIERSKERVLGGISYAVVKKLPGGNL